SGSTTPDAQTLRTLGGSFCWSGHHPRPVRHRPSRRHTPAGGAVRDAPGGADPAPAARHAGPSTPPPTAVEREKERTVATSSSASDTTFDVYDTTLRDGAQQEGMNLSVADKLAIAPLLDELGVGFIEGGWPGAIPKDTEFFRRAGKELELRNAVLAAFGSTRRPGGRASQDPQVRALLDAGAPVVTLVAKSDVRHVERALRTTPEENLAMIADTVRFLVGE